MFVQLIKYQLKGNFNFKVSHSLEERCNAPTDKSGVYLVFETKYAKEKLLYIGSSGQKSKEGGVKTRKSGLGGMRDRIVNGYHPKFGKTKRKYSWPQNMKTEGISEISIFWWVTWDGKHNDFPTNVETMLKEEYVEEYGCLPPWHK